MTRTRILFVILLTLGTLGVVSTYSRLSLTTDEAYHTWCGMEWWEKGSYTREPLHPPLARVMAAAPGFFTHDEKGEWIRAIPKRDAYMYKMVLARLGVLPFYIFSCFLVFRWSRQLYGDTSALVSLALYITLSTVTGHAGLATTDMAYAALLLWAIMASIAWLKTPDLERSLLMGISVAMIVGCKFSALVHYPAAMGLIILAQIIQHRKQHLPFPIRLEHVTHGLAWAFPAAFLVLGAIYHFSFAAFFQGLHDILQKNDIGHATWLFHALNRQAVSYFFPVVFFFKTPLPFHIAVGLGGWREWKERRSLEHLYPWIAALGIMLSSLPSHINIGVRHVLPIYPLLAIPAGYGLWWLWNRKDNWRFLVIGLCLWQLANFVSAYPEHIAYFNELAGEQPEHISMDSDFNWAQGTILLDEAVRARRIDEIRVCTLLNGFWDAQVLLPNPPAPCPHTTSEAKGWIAISRDEPLLHPNNFTWLHGREPVQNIGRTMDLYYIAPQ